MSSCARLVHLLLAWTNVAGLRVLDATPHVAAKASRGALDGRTTRHASYAVRQRQRKIVEESSAG